VLLVLVEDAREEMDPVRRMALGGGVGREVVSSVVTVAWSRRGAARVDGFRSIIVQICGTPAWGKALAEALAEVGITPSVVSGVKGGASSWGIGNGGSTRAACGSKIEVVIGVFQHSSILHKVAYVPVTIAVWLRIPSANKAGIQTTGYVGSGTVMVARSATGGTGSG